ncbi:hypothetical protein [Fontibacillus sp. BL9]|uniref:hypothetical protein n=1 Tax=Fontibacillus sp. BL9 TaxID=3389971 RepID=UPI00397E6641
MFCLIESGYEGSGAGNGERKSGRAEERKSGRAEDRKNGSAENGERRTEDEDGGQV